MGSTNSDHSRSGPPAHGGGPQGAIRLLALDLDDTLLGSDKQIHPRDLAALRQAQASGTHVAIVTGRPLQSSQEYARQIAPGVPVIATGGALIYDGDGRLLHSWRLPAETARAMARWAGAADIFLRADYLDDFYLNRCPAADIWNPNAGPYRLSPHEHVVEDLAAGLDDDPFQVVTYGSENVWALLRAFGHLEGETFRLLALPDRDKPLAVHVTHPHATKGMALAWLAEYLGVDRTQTMAFGDGVNDLPMLCYAGVAVASAKALPAARWLADVAVPGPGGIADILEQYGVIQA